jgi:hypothetical protein
LHPFNLHAGVPFPFSSAWFRAYARRAPETFRQWIKDADTIITECGMRVIFVDLIKTNAGATDMLAAQDAFGKARTEPLITLGSAPLAKPGFRGVVLGQLGEPRLVVAIDTDIGGKQAHSKALDADTKGPLRDIHRRVGTAILFQSSGGQTEKVAHLPELRFALGKPPTTKSIPWLL